MIRKAQIIDIPFLVRAVWLSEMTGYELYSYRDIFNLSEQEFIAKFSEILKTETPGHNLTYHDFWVYTVNDTPAGAFSLYLEGTNGNSAHLATGVLMEHFSREELTKGFQKLAAFKSIQFSKTKNTYQLDSVAVFPEFRGQGIFGKMLTSVFEHISPGQHPATEIQVWVGNNTAIQVYQKNGFTIRETKLHEGTNQGRLILKNF